MRSTLRAVGLVTVVSLLAWSLQALLVAADGVLVSEKTTTAGRTETHQIQIERNRMRAEVTGPTGEVQAVIFDGAKQTMWILNLDKKTYSEITKADMDQVAGQMSAAMAQMQEMMRGMPPEQRAQMEAMMRGRGMPGMGAAPPQTEYRKAGTDRVGTTSIRATRSSTTAASARRSSATARSPSAPRVRRTSARRSR